MKNNLLRQFIMLSKLTFYGIFLQCLFIGVLLASSSEAQKVKKVHDVYVTLDGSEFAIKKIFEKIEENSDFEFSYYVKGFDPKRKIKTMNGKIPVSEVLMQISKEAGVSFRQINNVINVRKSEGHGIGTSVEIVLADVDISGKITDENGEGLPGASVIEKGTSNGTTTNLDGQYKLSLSDNATLVVSFVGYKTTEIELAGRSAIDFQMELDAEQLEEVVVIGYGTVQKRDLTGSVARSDIESFRDQPNVSIGQSLQGAIAGLNVGQINRAGGEPNISIRGRTSISGAQNPLVILDGVIYRGSLIDINPNDIGTLDVLKDNSAAAVYGSQAANGVILITTKKGKNSNGKPRVSYSANYTFQQPINELVPLDGDEWVDYMLNNDLFQSRTAASDYLDLDPNYPTTSNFYDTEQVENYNDGKVTNWGDLLTNDHLYTQNHNLSLSAKTENINYLISLGVSDVKGYMINEDYSRYNARLNADSKVNDWFTVGVQTFFSSSDYSGEDVSPDARFLSPYIQAYKENGELNYPNSGFQRIWQLEADNLDVRNNLFGNIYAKIDFPFLKGLSYKINLANTQITNRDYTFNSYFSNGLGEGQKSHAIEHNMLSDNILTYDRTFYEKHKIGVTLLYGFEKRNYDQTISSATSFVSTSLGYNSLQSGSSELQKATSQAWEEASLYSMARLLYTFNNRYLFTGTIRRDGFSGFSEGNKFGVFPSMALGWVISEESFLSSVKAIDFMKIRVGYGSTGNRTIGRYQTLAKVSDDFGYITESETSVYTKYISSLASSNLQWETTTGLNLGVDFEILDSKISGSVDYYNNNTTNLLYEVDVPSIGRFGKFPDNLGKIHNQGIEITLSTINLNTNDLTWSTDFSFSRNRDQLKELLGFDNDMDGVEDNLISEKLFIGEPLDVVYHFETSGDLYQIGDDIPTQASIGSYKIVDQNGDGTIDQINDYTLLGYSSPSYRFSIGNTLSYGNWSLFVFVNSIQGGNDYYYKLDDQTGNVGGFNDFNSGNRFNGNIPKNYDAWLPENTNAMYERIGAVASTRAMLPIQRNFVRIQDISLSYRFSSEVLEKLRIQNLKLFISAKNLATFTKWPGLDPETGDSYNSRRRPVLRSISFGLNLDF